MRLAVVCLVAALALSATATGATPKPWHWTTTQARTAITAKGDELQYPRDAASIRCRGIAKATPGRFTTFRCLVTFDEGPRLTLNAKARRAGGLCWAPGVVPSRCLAPGKRASGSLTEVARAVYGRFGAPAQTFTAMPHGSGFYSWTWVSGAEQRRGTVTFTPRPVLRLLP